MTGRVVVATEGGATYEIDADARAGGGYMSGGGYGGHHGKPAGRDHVEHDVYPLDGSVSPRTVDTSLTDRLAAFMWDGHPGLGIFEFALTRSRSYTYEPTISTALTRPMTVVAPGIARITITTPWPVGPVNVFLIDDDPLTLVDTGQRSADALAAVEAGLAAHGRRVEDLERIVITHQHIDHSGLAATLVARSGAELCALAPLADWLETYPASAEAEDDVRARVARAPRRASVGAPGSIAAR